MQLTSPIVELLDKEISRLKATLANRLLERSERIATLDARIAELERQIEVAEELLATYAVGRNESNHIGARRMAAIGSDAADDAASKKARILLEIEATEIPSSLRDHPFRDNSKRAKIIKASKVYLEILNRPAHRNEILCFLMGIDIMGNEKKPAAYLSVILSQAKEVFVTDGVTWRLRAPP